MQPAFSESLIEVTNSPAFSKPKLRFATARERRNYLLDGEKGEGLHYDLWRYRPGQKYHELWKLLAQISFGVYLLLNGIANSNEQVINILQGHIDEVDEFLETILEDVSLAIHDIQERIDHLKLPVQNIRTFEQMLEDRSFRLQVVTGNEKIEHIISRTTTSLEAMVEDIGEGLGATKEFAAYLGDQQDGIWQQLRPDVGEIFDAMRGNAQGWYKAFLELQRTTSNLRGLLNRLDQIVAEMNYRAGEVSRRTRASIVPFSSPTSQPLPKSGSRNSSMRSSDRWLPKYELSKTTSQRSIAGSTETRETLMIVQYNAPIEPMSPVELEADTVPRMAITIEEGLEPADEEEEEKEKKEEPPADEGLYILQPRTYTPQPPAPIPSPRIHNSSYEDIPIQDLQDLQIDDPLIENHPIEEPPIHDTPAAMPEEQPKRTSLRQRLSLKGSNLPEAIQVPSRNAPEFQRPVFLDTQYQSPGYLPSRAYQGPDSAYGSDNETRQPIRSVTEYGDMMPPPIFSGTALPSPRSERQHYFPVRASPHSPLQQRPWTAGTHIHEGHLRNQPSAMGMSMLSHVTTPQPETQKAVKKKRSAFGWLKKAFSLDDEERAEFEARKAQQTPNPYYESRSPKYLDGKRVPDYRRR
ncbi:uncharacterized protein F4812DRAFT_453098 [Daldinia caldariorum]|uniref:uncharacterized protein n=1 Tax=Daldinia caldariorum TaxID=326644 RepID=UPI002007B8CF|nr:uncharacterized protein F4812DRAFT_453098 [Daldinia caldariorum]KAI1464245.1 hypothetical protein F4812DRAFT_453098 [Daldinia caldariorum]